MKENPEMPHIPAGKYTRVMIQGEAYGVQASRVRAVVRKPGVRRVPRAPSFIEGVAAIDGRIVPVLNPVKRLDLADEDAGALHPLTSSTASSLVMVEVGNVLYGLSVDHVADIMDIPGSAIEPVNPVVVHDNFPFIAAMAKVGDQLIYLLNIDGVVLSGLEISQTARDQYDHFAVQLTRTLTAPVGREETKYLVFSAGREQCGMESSQLKSVVPASLVEKRPDANQDMVGLLPMLNGMLPVVDLATKLGLAPSNSRNARVVVVEAGECQYGLLVDGVSEFLRLSPDEIKPVPPAIAAKGGTHIKGIAMPAGENRMFTLLDALKFLTDQELDAFSRRDDIKMKPSDTKTPGAAPETLMPLLVVTVADMTFALPIAQVSEVIRAGEVKPVPRTPAHIRGLITVRGEPLPLMNLARRLDLTLPSGSSQKEKGSRVVVIQADQLPFAIEVDTISGIVKVPREKIVAPPDIIKNVDTRFLSGLVLLDGTDSSAMVLDVKALMDQDA